MRIQNNTSQNNYSNKQNFKAVITPFHPKFQEKLFNTLEIRGEGQAKNINEISEFFETIIERQKDNKVCDIVTDVLKEAGKYTTYIAKVVKREKPEEVINKFEFEDLNAESVNSFKNIFNDADAYATLYAKINNKA